MTAVEFIVYIFLITIVFFAEDYIVIHLNRWLKDAKIDFFIKERWLTYALIIIITIVVTLGMFIDDTGYQESVSNGLKNMHPKDNDTFFNFSFDVFNF